MMKYIVKDLTSVSRYLPYGLLAGVIVVLILSAINGIRVRKNKEPFSVVAVSGFVMFTVIMLFITFLSREDGARTGIDLKLFSTWGINTRNNAFVVENVLLFIPYGFFGTWVFRRARRLVPCVMAGMIFSLAIECVQHITGRGFFQIDDVLTNTLGTLIGFILFYCCRGLHLIKKDKR